MQHSRSDAWCDMITAAVENFIDSAFRSTHFCISGNAVRPSRGPACTSRLVAKGNQPAVEMALVFSVCVAAWLRCKGKRSSHFCLLASLYDYVALQVLSWKTEMLQLKELEGEGGGIVITCVEPFRWCSEAWVCLLCCSAKMMTQS